MKFTRLSTALIPVAIVLAVLFGGWLISGCQKDSPSGPALSSATMVNMAASFSKSALATATSSLFVDSLHIDSAVVVFQHIEFLPHADSARIDSGDDEHDSDEHESEDHNDSLMFRGPFVVHVRDTVEINFANRELPAGEYDGVRFKIHRLSRGEQHEDSDERNHHHHSFATDSVVTGSSITVWGSVYKNGSWTPFTFRFNGEFEFKIKGNFVVPAATSAVNIALNIDMGKWFISPVDGSILDPTNTSDYNLRLFRRAIRFSFDSCRGGHDRGDGHPDD